MGRGKAGWPRGKDVEPTFVATGVCEVGNAPETRVEDSATTNALAVGFHVESHGRSNAMFRALMRLKCTQGAEGRHRLTALRTNVTSEYAGSRCGCFVRFVAVASRVEVTKSMHSREPPLFVSNDAVIPQSRLGVRLGHVGEGGGCGPQAPHVINDQVGPWQTATFMLKSKDGLQRSQFMPAISLLQKHTHVLHVAGAQDYRLRVLEQAEIWHAPLDVAAERNLESYFAAIAPDTGSIGQSIEILGRAITTRRRADGIAWFNYEALCDGPRSQDDYIEIARAFQTVLLSNVPVMGVDQENQARRFIALVDEFYERKVKLITSAERPNTDIYSGKRLTMEFQRTSSRLLEMQSHAYLAAPHIT